MKKTSPTVEYFRQRGEEALKWATEAGEESAFREGFMRMARVWFEAAAQAELSEEALWTAAHLEAGEPASLH